MKTVALIGTLLVAGVASAQQDLLPPPPPPPPVDEPAAQPPPPPPPAYSPPIQAEMQEPSSPPRRTAPAPERAAFPPAPEKRTAPSGTIGEGPVAPAGSPAAPLHPDETVSNWRYSLASGVSGRWGGMELSSTKSNTAVMIFFGGQADGLWTQGLGKAARLRLRVFLGGEDVLFAPSDGDAEAAFMLGRRELRFVIGRVEAARWPALGLQLLLQGSTLPCFEGSISFAGDRMRFYYYISPIGVAYAYYYKGAHLDAGVPGWPSETKAPSASSAFRARYTVMVPPSVLLSVSGDFMKMWDKPDIFFSVEGSAGVSVLDGSVVLNALIVLQRYTRRGLVPETSVTDEEVKLLGVATLAF